jgi:hypothetical protein
MAETHKPYFYGWLLEAYTAIDAKSIGGYHINVGWTNPDPPKTSASLPLLREMVSPPDPAYKLNTGIPSVETLPCVASELHRSVAVWCNFGDVSWRNLPAKEFPFSCFLKDRSNFGFGKIPARAGFDEKARWIRLTEAPANNVEYRISWTRLLPTLREARKHRLSLDQLRDFVISLPEPLAQSMNDVTDERQFLSTEDQGLVHGVMLARAFFRLAASERKRVGKKVARWRLDNLPSLIREDVATYLSSDSRFVALLNAFHPDFDRTINTGSLSARLVTDPDDWLEIGLEANGFTTVRLPILRQSSGNVNDAGQASAPPESDRH